MNNTFIVRCDMVNKATGQAKQGHLYGLIDDFEIDTKTRIMTNDEFQTSNPKYFAGGDTINGSAEVVNAAYDGKMAAQGIHNWLTKKQNTDNADGGDFTGYFTGYLLQQIVLNHKKSTSSAFRKKI